MSLSNLPALWASLRTSAPADIAGDFRMRLCHEAHELRVFAAVAAHSQDASLVIEIPQGLSPRRLSSISSRRFSVSAGGVAGMAPERAAIVVRLRDASFEDLFSQLCDDLVAGIRASTSTADAIQSISRLVERWRRFLDQRQSALSDEEVRGLVGELSVLERSAVRIGATAALGSWKAPQGAIRDFEFNDRTIEVKATLAAAGGSIRINDPMQLQPEPGVPLFLACQELARSDDLSAALPGHVSRLRNKFAHDLKLVEDFEDALAAYGYLARHAEIYTQGFSLGQLHTFSITDEFPRITPDAIPLGVSRVQFSLEMPQLLRFRVDTEHAVGKTSQSAPQP